ncbi:MAG: nucleotidyltransferase domain-containing protein, partial [Polyangiaceae bacterium]|nr:nucleotidyltransferase domain-containing protein [Polyangiaceae bacterium]
MNHRGNIQLRLSIAREAARLMYEEDVKQYLTAKRIASRRVCGRVGGKQIRYRPAYLPSNGEIREQLLELAELAEGPRRMRRLFAMRITALEAMEALDPFDPRLIGSVSTGHVRRGSDIDLHVFTDDEDALFDHLKRLRWTFETERVSTLKLGKVRDYLHVHIADIFSIELTVYERRELRFRPRSSTDGKPIDRLNRKRLMDLLASEHPEQWFRYLQDGIVEDLDDILDEDENAPRPGPFDGLLATSPLDPLPTVPDEDGDEYSLNEDEHEDEGEDKDIKNNDDKDDDEDDSENDEEQQVTRRTKVLARMRMREEDDDERSCAR